MSICDSCAENKYLAKIIEAEGTVGVCSNCKKERLKVFNLSQLANLISPVIHKHFWTSEELFWPAEEMRATEAPEVFSLGEIVATIMNSDIDFLDELVEAIVEGEVCDLQNGETAFFDDSRIYAPMPEEELVDYFSLQWNNIVEELKYNRRFFSDSVRNFFDAIFSSVNEILAVQSSPVRFLKPVRTESEGFLVYRGRIVDSDEIGKIENDPFKEVGPTPKEKARSGRMSPEGIVALYCATEKKTAIAELRPAIGQISAVIELRFSRALTLLDFRWLEHTLDEGWSSYLDPQYKKNSNIRGFLRKLHFLISQPVMPGKEADYLITQTMAEYLSHVRKPGFDGIVFASSQFKSGTNIVLFGKDEPLINSKEFSVNYVPGSLSFHRTEEVNYEHRQINRELQGSLFPEAIE